MDAGEAGRRAAEQARRASEDARRAAETGRRLNEEAARRSAESARHANEEFTRGLRERALHASKVARPPGRPIPPRPTLNAGRTRTPSPPFSREGLPAWQGSAPIADDGPGLLGTLFRIAALAIVLLVLAAAIGVVKISLF